MAFVFQKPTTRKSGTETLHSFHVTGAPLKASLESPPADALKATVQQNSTYLNEFLAEFLRSSSAYFAKPYSSATILKHLVHDLKAAPPTSGLYSFTPVELMITAKGFCLLWSAIEEPLLIALPDMEEDASELEPTELPLTGTENVLELQPPTIRHIYDKQRVKEANLRAKLAQYKANRTHMEYLQKYGEDPSDSEDSDSEENSEDDSQ
jgi:hypothetical protein